MKTLLNIKIAEFLTNRSDQTYGYVNDFDNWDGSGEDDGYGYGNCTGDGDGEVETSGDKSGCGSGYGDACGFSLCKTVKWVKI